MALLVIKIVPSKPLNAVEFRQALVGLELQAFDLSFVNPDGNLIGSAAYIAPDISNPNPGPDPAPVQDADNRIVQHFAIGPAGPNLSRSDFAVATALIEVPGGPEYKTLDLKLEITRGGGQIKHDEIYFNVPVDNGAMPADRNAFQNIDQASLYLLIPPAGQQLDPNDAYVETAPDGTPPNYQEVLDAINKVVADDPGVAVDLKDLTEEQSRHIAFEIAWNENIHPTPQTTKDTLEKLYTLDHGNDQDDDGNRRRFEGELQSHYAQRKAEAERLSKFVYAVSAALWAEQQSLEAKNALFRMPVVPGIAAPMEVTNHTTLILEGPGGGALNPAFEVEAHFFYALAAELPPLVDRDKRYQMAIREPSEKLLEKFEDALAKNVITPPTAGQMTIFQATRRLTTLFVKEDSTAPRCIPVDEAIDTVQGWLDFQDADIQTYWSSLTAVQDEGHLQLLLCALGRNHQPFIDGILAEGVTSSADLKTWTEKKWRDVLTATPNMIPDFIYQGSPEERQTAFIHYIKKFFELKKEVDPAPVPTIGEPPVFGKNNIIQTVIGHYPGVFTYDGWNDGDLATALSAAIPNDFEMQSHIKNALICLKGLFILSNGVNPPSMQFSIMEALWARGMASSQLIAKYSFEDFQKALTGSVAYDFALIIYNNANTTGPTTDPNEEEFVPVNPDGLLTNCIPPLHLSPLGPVNYLKEMLELTPSHTCKDLDEQLDDNMLSQLLASRRGEIANMQVTDSNLSIPLPVIDLVNESLEFLTVNLATPSGVIYNTAIDEVGGHKLSSHPNPPEDEFLHDPERLLETVPEHSTPATPVKEQTAYDVLKNDFSSPKLPYNQGLDISRSYLNALGSDRFDAMRRFRKDITEFVLDPVNEPADFQTHLWRYPVRLNIALEYLQITSEEFQTLYESNLSAAKLRELFGFHNTTIDGEDWKDILMRLPEFLKRTGLTYCEFTALWKSEYVPFKKANLNDNIDPDTGAAVDDDIENNEFPVCEPCCLKDYNIEFIPNTGVVGKLKKLIVFIRLWKKLQEVENAGYTFSELADIAEVLQLFIGNNINPDFIRQLIAFQMLKDDFELSLTDGSITAPGQTGADRLHLLSFWVPGASKFDWAVEHLLYQIQQYKDQVWNTDHRSPEFIKILRDNLDPISALAGFDPTSAQDSWHHEPTHTLRFTEILAKIYASTFNIGELIFLFTAEDHLQGDDPFPLQTKNETKSRSLELPDDEDEFYLMSLRKKLLSLNITDDDTAHLTWQEISSILRNDYNYDPLISGDVFLSMGKHFFPSILEQEGLQITLAERLFSAHLLPVKTSELMWNTPSDGPFTYHSPANELRAQIPLTDESVIEKLSRVRQLNSDEQKAVKDLYFQPRAMLAPFSFIFWNFGEAEERLIQETDESKRWTYFKYQFFQFHKRAQLIAEHLSEHVADVLATREDGDQNLVDISKIILKNLWADENKALGNWENDNGQIPSVKWQNHPTANAYSALLGLTGTGLRATYYDQNKTLRWDEIMGGINAYGPEENSSNSSIPTLIPAMDFSLPPEQLQFISLRNGYALSNPDGKILGGAEPFFLNWEGLLLIEKEGKYAFSAGGPTPDGEMPDFEAIDQSHRWRVTLRQGQKTWILLSHDWPNEESPADSSEAIALKKGFYEIQIEIDRLFPVFDGPEDVCPQTTGFQLKYKGNDTDNRLLAVPYDKLFQAKKEPKTLDTAFLEDPIQQLLNNFYTSTIRDIRRTYQRAFKAVLFCQRFNLSPLAISDSGQSELEYMITNADKFSGQSYYRDGGLIKVHKADFDFNFLPILDSYHAPTPSDDQRSAPSSKRQQAMFDWWERVFDYATLRKASGSSPEQPVWLLFHEAKELHPDESAHLLRHMGIDLRHSEIILKYYSNFSVSSAELENEMWAIRIWNANELINTINHGFLAKDIRDIRPDLWVSDDPNKIEAAETETGNSNLTHFFRNGSIENGQPHRYEEIKSLNDALRIRGRDSLVSFLIGMDRLALPWGGFAKNAKELSEFLLQDVNAGICQKASRIEELISSIQLFVQRARLGLEPGFTVTLEFKLLWDSHFVNFKIWESCKRKMVYKENWIEWKELEKAQKTEAFQFLESELRSATLTIPVPGSLAYWEGDRPTEHPGVSLLQNRQVSTMQLLEPSIEGLGLMGTPDRHARPTWLAPLNNSTEFVPPEDNPNIPGVAAAIDLPAEVHNDLPLWLQAAVRLGVKFIRVAAASIPQSSTLPKGSCIEEEISSCCKYCSSHTSVLMDEYYFWLENSEGYDEVEQNADWGVDDNNGLSDWHREEKIPELLHWDSKKAVKLKWVRVHHGEFQPPRQSYEIVYVSDEGEPELAFLGRTKDSLNFFISNGITPIGYDLTTPAGFRYDIPTDEAIALPHIVAPVDGELDSGLSAFPFFIWFDKGAPLLPSSWFGPSLTVAGHLRSHCRFESALKWYEMYYAPLSRNNAWIECNEEVEIPGAVFDNANVPISIDNDCCCASQEVSDDKALNRSILLHYVETLIQWGESLMRKNTPEAYQHARLIFETACKILGPNPISVKGNPNKSDNAFTIGNFEPECAPINERLLCLYNKSKDSVDLVHHCINASRLKNGRPNKDMPYFGDKNLLECWKSDMDTCAEATNLCLPQSPYRFLVLIQKAKEIVAEVKNLGSALLSAYEKGDAEYLLAMRTKHERQLLELTLEIRKNQWREADWQVQALGKTKEIAILRRQYYVDLIASGLKNGEIQYDSLTLLSMGFRTAGNTAEVGATVASLIPDIFVGFPCTLTQPPVGTKLAEAIFLTVARIMNALGDRFSTYGGLELTRAGWDRREDEWQHQVQVLDIEIEQIERQVLAANRRREIALRELNNHQQQLENIEEVHDFMRDKFTKHGLYLWIQQETAALYYRMYELGLHCAHQAQRAFNYERGHTARKFIPTNIWDNLRDGLLSGERLQLSLNQIEKAYYDENTREYELSKHISLRNSFPMSFLQLQTTGYCEIDIPEWMFDHDYPGHFMRRIKNVSLSIPCIVGPYTGVHAKLTLLSSKTRVSPILVAPPHDCCDKVYSINGYPLAPDDNRMIRTYAATEAIATSSGQNDAGLFELNFRDERYLPFEFAGAVSRWRLELPIENNYFDFNSLNDIILHLNYTAREGGDMLQRAASEIARYYLPGAGVRLFNVKHELPDEWHLFISNQQDSRLLHLNLKSQMFPYIPGLQNPEVNKFELFFKTSDANIKPGMHHIIKYYPGLKKGKPIDEECDLISVHCVADAQWPGYYHGVVEVDIKTVENNLSLGRFVFPEKIIDIKEMVVLCVYSIDRHELTAAL